MLVIKLYEEELEVFNWFVNCFGYYKEMNLYVFLIHGEIQLNISYKDTKILVECIKFFLRNNQVKSHEGFWLKSILAKLEFFTGSDKYKESRGK